MKFPSLIAVFGKELFSSPIERGGRGTIIEPVEMVGSGEDQRWIRGLESIRGICKVGRPSLGCFQIPKAPLKNRNGHVTRAHALLNYGTQKSLRRTRSWKLGSETQKR